MFDIDSCSFKKSVPFLIAILIVAQIDLASAFGWPIALLSLLHLTPATNDLCRGVCAGIGTSLDVIVLFQFVRMWAKRALEGGSRLEQD
ncbi:MAG TPA: hypothetical protein VMT38_11710 [Terracidiphilus sp.]|nr:hypothetical protein [Terracidiphilus sp.]